MSPRARPRAFAPRLALAFGLAIGLGAASPPAAGWLLDGQGDASRWTELRRNPPPAACRSASCALMRAVIASFAALDERDFPNSMSSRASSGNADAQVPLLGRGMAKQAEGACAQLARIAAASADDADRLHALEIGSRLEPHRAGCLDPVISAVAAAPDGANLVGQAAELCAARRQPACSKLAAGAH